MNFWSVQEVLPEVILPGCHVVNLKVNGVEVAWPL